MVEYTCELCKFSTKYKNDYTRHTQRKKHILKVEEHGKSVLETPKNSSLHVNTQENTNLEVKQSANLSYKCDACGNVFNRINNLTRHYKICIKKDNEMNELKALLNGYKKEKENDYKEIEFYKEEMKYYKKLLFETGKMMKSSVNSLTYVMENYSDAPAIQTISCNVINKKRSKINKLIEEILCAYRNKVLDKFLGDTIVDLYKKDNPEDQSIWNTDSTRLTYLLKEILGNKNSIESFVK